MSILVLLTLIRKSEKGTEGIEVEVGHCLLIFLFEQGEGIMEDLVDDGRGESF
jgi:hypothetical protein